LYFAICATFCHAQVTQAWLLKENGIIPIYHILTQEKGQYFMKNYQRFKGEYWLINQKQDTLSLEANGTFKGSKYPIFSENGSMYLSISGKKTRKSIVFVPLNPCDTQINYIQNRAYTFHIRGVIRDSAKLYIGYSNNDFEEYCRSLTPSYLSFLHTCSETFQEQSNTNFQLQLTKIRTLFADKALRMKHLQNKTEMVDENYVLKFMDKIDYCEMDKRAFFHLVLNYTDVFVKASDKFNPDSWELQHITEKMPRDLDLTVLKQKLLLTKIKWFSEKTHKDDVY
jgi:hypothetical protein